MGLLKSSKAVVAIAAAHLLIGVDALLNATETSSLCKLASNVPRTHGMLYSSIVKKTALFTALRM